MEFRLQAGPEVFRRSRLLSRQPQDLKGRSDRSTRVNAELQTGTSPGPCRRRPQLRSCTRESGACPELSVKGISGDQKAVCRECGGRGHCLKFCLQAVQDRVNAELRTGDSSGMAIRQSGGRGRRGVSVLFCFAFLASWREAILVAAEGRAGKTEDQEDCVAWQRLDTV